MVPQAQVGGSSSSSVPQLMKHSEMPNRSPSSTSTIRAQQRQRQHREEASGMATDMQTHDDDSDPFRTQLLEELSPRPIQQHVVSISRYHATETIGFTPIF